MCTFMQNIMLSKIVGLENYYSNNMQNTTKIVSMKNSYTQSRSCEIKFKLPIYDNFSRLLSIFIFIKER